MAKRPNNKGKKPARPASQDQLQGVPAEMQEAVRGIRDLVRECPEGWGMIAEAIKSFDEAEPSDLIAFLAMGLGKEALPLLRGLATEADEELAVGALKALPLLGTRAAGEALAEIYAGTPEGDRRRMAWQGVEALRAQGINVSVPAPEDARQAVAAYQLREMWETLPDGVGSREAIARVQDRYGVWHSVMVTWNDRAGVKDGFRMPMSKKDWTQIAEHHAAEGIILVPTPPDYTRWQVAQAGALNAQTGFPLENHLDEWNEILGPAPEGYTPPDPLERVRAMSEEEREKLVDHLHCLFHVDTFRTWAFEPADVRPWFDRWLAVDEDESKSDDEKDDAVEEILAEAVRGVVDRETALVVRDRLVDASRKLTWTGNEHEADIAAAAAFSIEAADDLGEVPILQMLVDNGLGMLAEILEDGEDPEELRYDPMQPMEEHPHT